jgi:hypothetical protein
VLSCPALPSLVRHVLPRSYDDLFVAAPAALEPPMSLDRVVFVAALLVLPMMGGCSGSSNGSPPTATPTTAAATASIAATTPSREDAKACDLVTSQEMSAILGTAVVGSEPGHKSSNLTACEYSPSGASTPSARFSVEWGEAEIAMRATGAMNKKQPGIADPYAGIGDQAVAVGPMLWIRSGKDLVKIMVSGVDDAPAKAKKIFETAKARM